MLFLLFLAPFFFNLTGLIDTYLISLFSKEQNNWTIENSSGTLMIIWWIIALLVSFFAYIYLWNKVFDISPNHIYILIFSGILYGFAARPYFQALKTEKIENIIPFLQTIPIFTYILWNIFLWETLSTISIILMILIVIVTWLFSWDFTSGRFKIAWFLWTWLAALLYSSSYITFKLWWWESISLWTSYFWEHIGVALSCLLFLFDNKIRSSTFNYFRYNWIWFSLLNIWNEFFFIMGMLIQNALILIYTTAFINTIISWLQPLFWFIMVYIAYKILPQIYIRDYSKKEILYKLILCIASFWLLYAFYIIQ